MRTFATVVTIIAWMACIGCVVVAFLVLITGFAGATGAPQEAVAAALACAIAILPYCAARAISEIMGKLAESVEPSREERLKDPTAPIHKTDPPAKPAYNYKTLDI